MEMSCKGCYTNVQQMHSYSDMFIDTAELQLLEH